MRQRTSDEGPYILSKKWIILAAVSIILSAGIVAYNADHLYSYNRSQLSAVMPSDYSGGERVNFPALVYDIAGNPRRGSNVEVYLEKDGSVTKLTEGETSFSGSTNLDFELPEGEYDAELVIKSSGEEIRKDIHVRGQQKLFVSTDKPIYQPGQTVHIRALAFEGNSPLGSDQEVTYTIQTPEGDKIFRKSFSPNEYGITFYNYTLSELLPLGRYEIKVSVGQKAIKEAFLVDRYVLPRFDMSFRGLQDWYLFGDSLSSTLDVSYFFGKDVSGKAIVRLEYNDQAIDRKSDQLEDGQFPFYFNLPNYGEKDHFTLNATVIDDSGHGEYDTIDIPIAEEPIDIQMMPSSYVEGAKSPYSFRITHPDGSPAQGLEITMGVNGESFPTLVSGNDGIVTWNKVYEGEESVSLTCEYEQSNYTHTFDIEQEEGVILIPGSGHDRVGQERSYDVYYHGDSLSKNIYYSIQTEDQILYTDHFTMDDESYNLTIPITYEMYPEYKLNVYAINKSLQYESDSIRASVTQDEYMHMNITTNKNIYEPGEEARISFQVFKKGVGVNSAIEVKITDESLYELNQLSGLDKILDKEGEETEEPGFEVKTVGVTMDKARTVRNDWVNNYWSAITIIGILGFIAVFIFAMKKSAMAVCILAAVLIFGSVVSLTPNLLPDESTQEERDVDGGGDVAEPELQAGGADEGKTPAADTSEDDYSPTSDDSAQEDGSSVPRTNFPETWYWNPTLITDSQGNANINIITPDSITRWLIEGTASTKQGEMVGGNSDLTVRKEFFIEPDMPVSAVRNDRFELRVMVYNYQNDTINAKVTLQGDDWLEIHDNRTKEIMMEPNTVRSVYYDITALKVGENELSLQAQGGMKTDIIRKIMRVTPDGERDVQVFNGQLTDEDNVTISFTQDGSVIEGSQKAYLKLYGSMDSVTLDSAEGFIHQVSGCGEQSMSTLSIDVLAYNIVKNSENPPANLEEYEKIVVQGIQHELGFLKEADNGKGRGIVWFPHDQDVHPWLTSWGLITFQDAKDAGLTVDDKIIYDMQEWLVTQQNEDGSWEFPEWGLYETTNQILKAKKVATTAYITRSLIYSGYDNSSSPLSGGIDYITSHIDEHWDDAYTLSLSALAMKMAGETGSKYQQMIERIDELKVVENDTCHWESESSMLQSGEVYFGYNDVGSRTIETTGYALMALAGEGYGQVTNMAVQFLLDNRNEFGSFFSTQDTVVALQALQISGEVEIDQMNIGIQMNGEEVGSTQFTEENKDLTYLYDLRDFLEENNTVELNSDGSGKIAYQVFYEEYVEWDISDSDEITFEVYTPNNTTVNSVYDIEVRLRYNREAPYTKMGLLEIPLPTGFKALNYDDLLEEEHVSNWEVDDRVIRIYLTDLSVGSSIDFTLSLMPTRSGEMRLQGINFHDMYSPEIRMEIDPVVIDVE